MRPVRKQSAIDKYTADESSKMDFLFEKTKIFWEPYDPQHPSGYYKKIKHNPTTDELILQVVGKVETYARTTHCTQYDFFKNMLAVQTAYIATIQDDSKSSNGAAPGVDLNKPPRNFNDVMSWVDAADWIESY